MIRVFTAFSGYDSQCMALDRLGIEYELVGWSEIDKYAIQAHNAVYPNWANRNYGDISKIDWANVPDFDLFTYSFPCTDISSAGKQKGLQEGSGTRSSLLWECKKAIEAKKPKYLLMENVKALVSEKFMPFLMKWGQWLSEQGYSNFKKVLNSKDYGVPQNRERVFMVSILGEQTYHFPKPSELKLRLKDVLEQNVDDKYYLSQKVINTFDRRNRRNAEKGNGFKFEPTDGNVIAASVLTNAGSRDCDNYIIEPKVIQVANIAEEKNFSNPQVGIKEGDGLYLQTIERGGLDGISRTLKANMQDAGVVQNYRIRKLTERECFRLMGVSESDIDKIQSSGISKTQQYKMAGNSIVVDVLYHIFRKMFIEKENENNQLTLF